MSTKLAKHYDARAVEEHWRQRWEELGIYRFRQDDAGPVYSIDTPPPTVSGHLHLGHVYSYSHTDFIARFWRMNGYNVYYPMGFDDNGLPTERLVERREGVCAAQVGRQAFIEKCLEVSAQAEVEYRELWQRLGLSIDWRHTYRTIDEFSRRTSQASFLDLYRKGLVYHREAPAIWCPECCTSIAQADLADIERESVFYTLAFALDDGGTLEIATTRPELLPACVAIFVHPDDARFKGLVGKRARVPYFGQWVPILEDPAAEPGKGTGAVMCCTFGDTADVAWWFSHGLPLRVAIDRRGRLTELGGEFAGLPVAEARRRIVEALDAQGLLLGRRTISQSVRVHERCDTPVEYVVTPQWFVRVLERKEELLAAGEQIAWHPEHMRERYRDWVQNLNWDWCISRQRYFGVPFPVWYCERCGNVVVADEAELPVDPTQQQPSQPCSCGSTSFRPEADVLDTWATSSLSPQIAGQRLRDPALYARVHPFSLRPQAHEIIRTWAFYTIVQSLYHDGVLPWQNVAISGWGLAPEGTGKISKSRGGGPMPPLEMIERYSADAARYWAASGGPGKDLVISEEKIQVGARLATKLWNVASFAQRFLEDYALPADPPALTPADRWALARLQRLIQRASELLRAYDYAAAKGEIEAFFWRDLADNYLEMAKLRLYGERYEGGDGARFVLHHALLTVLKLLAPYLPYVTEEIYQHLFMESDGAASIHVSRWPAPEARFMDPAAETLGETLVAIATAVRRYKSDHSLSLGTEIARLQLATADSALAEDLRAAAADLAGVTRAGQIEIVARLEDGMEKVEADAPVQIALAMA